MAEYIEREALLKSKQWLSLQDRDKAMAKAIIQSQPASDVVGVVRCKNCDYSSHPEERIVWCNRRKTYMALNGFCSDGKEKE